MPCGHRRSLTLEPFQQNLSMEVVKSKRKLVEAFLRFTMVDPGVVRVIRSNPPLA